MTSQDFFSKVKSHITHKLPFAVYRQPGLLHDNHFFVKGIFQNDAALHYADKFTESGFVMAPFDLDNRQAVLIPSTKSTVAHTRLSLDPDIDSTPPENAEDTAAQKEHLHLVEQGINAITQGKLKKVVLSRKITVPITHAPFTLFQRLLKKYPTAFVYCWYHPKVGLWLGATPETLIKVTGKTLKTMALAGTKPAQPNTKPQWTSKEIEEQQFVTDFIADTLKDKINGLSITPAQSVRAGNLWHLKSNLTGRLTNPKKLKDILLGLHPTPAVCGVPKAASKQFILTHEKYDREFYTGFLGELNMEEKTVRRANRRNVEHQAYARPQRHTTLFVNLRCLQMQQQNCRLYVGGGLVKDSHPENEWTETVHKSRTMLDVL